MDRLLTADNLAIVVLAAWITSLKIENIALRKENVDNWKLVERMRRLTQRLFQSSNAPAINLDDTGSFYGTPQD